MRELRACYVCLDTKVRLLPFGPNNGKNELYSVYVALTGISSQWAERMYVCVICAQRLRHCYKLRSQCHQADAVLQSIVQLCGEVTEEYLEGMDRITHGLTHLQIHPCTDIIECIFDEDALGLSEVSVKCEDYILKEENITDFFRTTTEQVKVEENKTDSRTDALTDIPTDSQDWFDSEDEAPVASLLLRKKQNSPEKSRRKSTDDTKQKRKSEKVSEKKAKPTNCEEFCNIEIMSKESAIEELLKRRESSNYKNAVYRCELCYRGFWHQQTYDNHMLKHDPSIGQHECDICRLMFESIKSLKHHHNNFHHMKLSCKLCNHYSTNANLARRHEDWHRGKLYPCHSCNETFKRVSTLRSHVRRLHVTEYSCDICGLSFVGKRGVVVHKNRIHRQEKNLQVSDGPSCPECQMVFFSEEALKRHLVVSPKHRHLVRNGCEMCGETFNTAADLKKHSKVHAKQYPALYLKKKRGKEIDWPINCEQCEAVINNAREYKVHFQLEHPDKNRTMFPVWKNSFMCEECGRVFRNKALLSYHQRKHRGEKPFKCATCGKRFYLSSLLTAHARMHSGEMPYPCAVCGKRFNYKNNLDRHTLIHSGIKAHKCEYCGKGFVQKSEHKQHVEYVHLKKPWPKRERARRSDAAY